MQLENLVFKLEPMRATIVTVFGVDSTLHTLQLSLSRTGENALVDRCCCGLVAHR